MEGSKSRLSVGFGVYESVTRGRIFRPCFLAKVALRDMRAGSCAVAERSRHG